MCQIKEKNLRKKDSKEKHSKGNAPRLSFKDIIILILIILLLAGAYSIKWNRMNDYKAYNTSTLSYVKATVIEITSMNFEKDDLDESRYLGVQNVIVEITEGDYEGQSCAITNNLSRTHNIKVSEGQRVIVCVDAPENASHYFTIYNFAENDVDIVLMGHDHVYARSYIMGGETGMVADVQKDAEGNVLTEIADPDGVQYVTFNSASGSKYYDITNELFEYTAVQSQEKTPNYSYASVDEDSFTITTYRSTDNSVVDTVTITKTIENNTDGTENDNTGNNGAEDNGAGNEGTGDGSTDNNESENIGTENNGTGEGSTGSNESENIGAGDTGTGEGSTANNESGQNGTDGVAAAEICENWAEIIELLDQMLQEGTVSTLDVLVGQEIAVPKEIFNMLAGKEATIALHTGKEVTFSITGTEITKAVMASEMNLDVEIGAIAVPQEVINVRTAEALSSKEISIKNQNAFDMNINMHVHLKPENAGKYANLYRYNSITGQLEYQGSYLITEEGQAMFGLSRGGEYLVTITAKLPDEKVGSDWGLYCVE